MSGTMINVVGIVAGTVLGVLLGGRMSEHTRETVLRGLGLVTLVIGLQMTLDHTQNILIVLGSVLLGGILGEWWNIEGRLESLGVWLESRFNRGTGSAEDAARFIQGFVTASLVFCVGPLAILGAIQDGLSGDYRLLAIKSMLDAFAALAFSASMGIGVIFSAVSVLLYQGTITLLASQAERILSEPMIAEMTATGGILVAGIAVSSLLQIRKIRIGNFLPALLLAPLIVWGLTLLGMPVAPQF